MYGEKRSNKTVDQEEIQYNIKETPTKNKLWEVQSTKMKKVHTRKSSILKIIIAKKTKKGTIACL